MAIGIIAFNLIVIPLITCIWLKKKKTAQFILYEMIIIFFICCIDIFISMIFPGIISPDSLYGIIPFNIVAFFIALRLKIFGVPKRYGDPFGINSSNEEKSSDDEKL